MPSFLCTDPTVAAGSGFQNALSGSLISKQLLVKLLRKSRAFHGHSQCTRCGGLKNLKLSKIVSQPNPVTCCSWSPSLALPRDSQSVYPRYGIYFSLVPLSMPEPPDKSCALSERWQGLRPTPYTKPKHYIYRMDHDVGFAPNVQGDICILCGCKSSTVERWATVGSWIIGIGGLGTRKPDALIYAMRVDQVLPLRIFAEIFPRRSRYLRNCDIAADAPVLLSRYFYYFGDHAITLPNSLTQITIDRQGCKKMTDVQAALLHQFLSHHYDIGSHGQPNI